MRLSEEMSRYPKDFKPLGIALGLTLPQLESIRARYYGKNSNQIFVMLAMWRNSQSRDVDVRSKLTEGLESVARKHLAEKRAKLAQARVPATSYQTPLTDNELRTLSGKLGMEWQHLGTRLGLSRAQLVAIKADSPLQTSNQIFNMLITWRMTQSRDDDVMSILTENLKSVGRKDLAEEVSEMANLGQQGSDGFAVTALQDELAEHYRNTFCKVPTHPLFPAWVRDLDEIFVGPLLVDENGCPSQVSKQFPRGRDADVNRYKKTLKSHEDLLCLGGPGRYRVLLKGKPGSGKSTLVKKITYDWSNKQRREHAHKADDQSAFSRFTLLFPLNLNQMTGSKNLIDAIFDQILPRDTNVSKTKLNDFIKNHQEEVLFLLDGLDEIPASVFKTSESDSNLKDVLTGKALWHCLVITASRHHSVNHLLRSHPHYTVVETTGFESKEIKQYVKKYFTDESRQTQLLSEIQSSPTLRHLAEIPLLLLMVCLVWAEEFSLPKRLTELYDTAVKLLLGHHATKQRLQLENPRDVPEDLMRNLGQVALNGLFRRGGEQLEFFDNDFSPEDVRKGCDIGLLVQDSRPRGVEVQSIVTFLHKSFQEFCAASYLAELAETDSQKLEEFLSKVTVNTVDNMKYLFRFCSGKNTKAAELIFRHINELQRDSPVFDRDQYICLKLILAFEAGSENLTHLLSDVKTLPFLRVEYLPALNWLLQHLRCLSNVTNLEVECTSLADFTLIMDILKKTPIMEGLIVFMETDDTVERETFEDIPRLERLTNVNFSSFFEGCLTRLAAKFISRQTNLVEIQVENISMHGLLLCLQGCVRILEQLILYKCDLLSEDLNALCDILSAARNLKKLNLPHNNINGALRALLLIIPSLEKLDITDCGIRGSDAEVLSCLISAGSNLVNLGLGENDLHNHLDILMPLPPHLERLELGHCSLTEDDAEGLLRLSASAKKLETLDLHDNNLKDENIIKITMTTNARGTIVLLDDENCCTCQEERDLFRVNMLQGKAGLEMENNNQEAGLEMENILEAQMEISTAM